MKKFMIYVVFYLYLACPVANAQSSNEVLDDLYHALVSADNPNTSHQILNQIEQQFLIGPDDRSTKLLSDSIDYMAKGQTTIALNRLNYITETYPNFAEPWNRKGLLHYYLNAYTKSLNSLNKVLEIEPRNIFAYIGAGKIFRSRNELDKALAMYKKVLQYHPYNQVALAEISNIEKIIGQET
jgi:tetratricopeptide (TPR) repeat protein